MDSRSKRIVSFYVSETFDQDKKNRHISTRIFYKFQNITFRTAVYIIGGDLRDARSSGQFTKLTRLSVRRADEARESGALAARQGPGRGGRPRPRGGSPPGRAPVSPRDAAPPPPPPSVPGRGPPQGRGDRQKRLQRGGRADTRDQAENLVAGRHGRVQDAPAPHPPPSSAVPSPSSPAALRPAAAPHGQPRPPPSLAAAVARLRGRGRGRRQPELVRASVLGVDEPVRGRHSALLERRREVRRIPLVLVRWPAALQPQLVLRLELLGVLLGGCGVSRGWYGHPTPDTAQHEGGYTEWSDPGTTGRLLHWWQRQRDDQR